MLCGWRPRRLSVDPVVELCCRSIMSFAYLVAVLVATFKVLSVYAALELLLLYLYGRTMTFEIVFFILYRVLV